MGAWRTPEFCKTHSELTTDYAILLLLGVSVLVTAGSAVSVVYQKKKKKKKNKKEGRREVVVINSSNA